MERVVNFPSLTTKNNIILVHMMDLTATCGVPLRVTSTKMASGEGAEIAGSFEDFPLKV